MTDLIDPELLERLAALRPVDRAAILSGLEVSIGFAERRRDRPPRRRVAVQRRSGWLSMRGGPYIPPGQEETVDVR